MKVFMFNHSGSLNRGCEAIVRGTINILNKTSGKNEYILSSFAPHEDKGLTDMVRVLPFEPRPLNKGEHMVAAANIKFKNDESYSIIKSHKSFFEDAQSADICLSVGGDTYCYGNNSVIRTLTDELKKRGKKTVLWGASIGEEDLTTEKGENLACMDAVFARESLTYTLIKDKKINRNAFLFPDPAFTLEKEDLPLPNGWQEKNTIGINISPIVLSRNPDLMGITSGFIKRMLKESDMSIALIPHVTSRRNDDYALLEALFKDNTVGAHGRLLLLPADLNAAQYKGYIGRLRFFVGARTHATIAAYSNCVPSIVLGYSVKSRGIAVDIFGDERFVLDSGSIKSSDSLFDVFAALREQEAEIVDTCSKVMPGIIRRAYSAGTQLTLI